MLIVGGNVLSVPAAALAGPAGPAGPGDTGVRDVGNLVMNACLALLGSGAGLLAAFGPSPLHGRTVRIGLGTLTVGLGGLLFTSIIPIPSGSNSLVRTPGPCRVVGSMFVAGSLLFVAAIPSNAGLLSAIALTLVVLGVAGIGLLAINGDPSARHASA